MSVGSAPLFPSLLAVLLGGVALAGSPAPLVPQTPTGLSTVEQRHVYAPPDEGRITFPLRTNNPAPLQVVLEEPMMCEPSAGAEARLTYSKSRNEVVLEVDYDGLPYRMSYTRPEDVSTRFNRFPVSVREGRWQLWLSGRMFNFDTTFYYDATTLELLGSEYDLPGGPPPHSIPVPIPTLHMIASPLFEGQPNGKARVRFVFRYDQMLDEQGLGGSYFSFVPFSLCKPDEVLPYYTKGGLPVSMAMSFDQILESIWGGYGMTVSTSLEPFPKPEWLLSRDSALGTWGSTYPMVLPEGVDIHPHNGTLLRKETCGTRVNPRFPPAYYNLCAGL